MSNLRSLFRACVVLPGLMLYTAAPCHGGCNVHNKAHHTLPTAHQAYGKLQDNSTIGQWHDTVYWGISEPSDGHGIRDLNAWLSECDAAMPTYPPVFDHDVTITGAFVHPSAENGPRVHSAIDYARPDGRSFRVHSIADGRVIYRGYHPSTGNVIIIEHAPVDGQPFRSIYHHLRNGRDSDVATALRTKSFIEANKSWQWDVYSQNYQDRAERAQKMIAANNIDKNWMNRYWGTNQQTITVEEGDYVMSGQAIGWAGSTGVHCDGTHLHFATARQANFVDFDWAEDIPQPGDLRWTYFDPYGLYGGPNNLAAYNLDDGSRAHRQHASIFAPVPVDVIGLNLADFTKAQNYYSRFSYFPVTLSMDYLGDEELLSLLPFEGPKRAVWSISTAFRYRPASTEPLLLEKLAPLERQLVKASYQKQRPSAIIPVTSPSEGVRFTALMREDDNTPFLAEPHLDPETFQTHLDERRKLGYTLSNFTPYYEEGTLWFAASWILPTLSHPYQVRHSLSRDELQIIDKALAEDQYHLVRIHKYATPDLGYRYAAVWYASDGLSHGHWPSKETRLFLDLPPKMFNENRQSMEAAGFELTHIDSSSQQLNLIYKTFDRPDPSQDMEVAISLPKHVTLGDLMVENVEHVNTAYLPVYGEVLQDSCIAPPIPPELLIENTKELVQYRDPATRTNLPTVSKIIRNIQIQAETILGSIQVTEGKLVSQYMRDREGTYTNDMQVNWTNATRGAIMRVPLAVPRTGLYRLKLSYTQVPDAGVIQFHSNGRRIGKAINGYAEQTQHITGYVVADVDLVQGVNYLDLRMRGRDKRSEGHSFGIDLFELIPLEE